MPRAVGLDLGHRTLKAVDITGSAKSFKVHRIVVKEIPEGAEATPEARAALVREAFSQGRFGRDDVCSAFDAGSTIFREIPVPVHDDDQIEKVIRFEAENHLHGRAIEDVVVNWVKVSDTREGSQVLVFAAPKAALAEHLGVLRRAGIEPASIDLDATALYTACEASGVFAEHPSSIVLEVGARTTNLVLVSEGRLRVVRSFLVGADTVTAGLQQDLSLPPGEAQERALRGDDGGGDLLVPSTPRGSPGAETAKSVAELEKDAATARRDDFVRKLAREITRTVTSSRASHAPELLLIAGGGSLLPGLSSSLSDALGLPVEPLRLLHRLKWRSSSPNPELEEAVAPVAVGCALRLLGADPLGIELRREEFAPTNTFDVVRVPLAIVVTLLVVLLGGLAWTFQKQAEDEKYRFGITVPGRPQNSNSIASKAATIYLDVEKRYQQEVKNKSPEEATKLAGLARNKIPPDEAYLYRLRNDLRLRHRELEQDLGLSKDVPAIESALKVWKEVHASFDSIPRVELGFLRISKLSVTQSEAVISIEIDEPNNVDKLERALVQNEYFKTHTKEAPKRGAITNDQQAKIYKGTFTIKLKEPDDRG